MHYPLHLPRETTSERPKVLRTRQFLTLLTSKCASRRNGVHFFHISTPKSGPMLVFCVHFDFEMRFAPQRPTLFRHLNFQKRSDTEVFCTFWLPNVLCATTACTFSTCPLSEGELQSGMAQFMVGNTEAGPGGGAQPKVVRHWGVSYILTWKCASRHNAVHFFDITTSKSGPRMVCFVHVDFKMCFGPQQRAIFHLSSGQMAPHPPL